MIVKKAVPGEWGIGSTADAMLQITKLPLLVVQPDAVRSLGRANLRSQHAPDEQVRCCHVWGMSCTSLLMSGYPDSNVHSTTALSLTGTCAPRHAARGAEAADAHALASAVSAVGGPGGPEIQGPRRGHCY